MQQSKDPRTNLNRGCGAQTTLTDNSTLLCSQLGVTP